MEQQHRQRQMSEEERKEEEEYDTFLYRFQQQIIDAWKPVPYTKNNVILYSILSFICITIGLILILTAPNTPVIEERYDDKCDSTKCQAFFTLDDTMPAGAYLYYGFTNYYQNHRRYLKFFSPDQMGGNEISQDQAQAQCGEEAYSNEQLDCTIAFDGTTALNPEAVAYPCGQRAKSFVKARKQIKAMKLKYQNGTDIQLDTSEIAWPADDDVYSNGPKKEKQCIDIMDQDWLVWFRPGARNEWFKLKAKIKKELQPGNYSFITQVTDAEQYDISDFGRKKFHISTSNAIGNRDHFLGIAFLSLGGGCIIVLIIFIAKLVTQIRERPKNS